MKSSALKWINTISLAAVLSVNALAELLPLGGVTTGEVAEAYPNLFSPAPYTFAIWGVIYLGLVFFVIYQWGIIGDGGGSTVIRDAVDLWFCAGCIFNIAWIFAWHYDRIGLSVAAIVGLLISLIGTVSRVKGLSRTDVDRVAADAPFDVYLGWIIAATIACVSVWLVSVGWDGFGLSDVFWCVAVLILGAVIGVLEVLIDGRRLTGITVIWALVGILVRHVSEGGFGGAYPPVIAAAILGIVVIAGAVVWKSVKR